MQKNLHTKLEEYSSRCDEIFLNNNLKKIIKEALVEIPQIEPNNLELGDNTVLLDVREPEEFASGYIDNKHLLTIPRGKLEFMVIEKVAKVYGQDANIITYCLKGPRGNLAALQLKKLGFTQVSNLEGGLLAWLKSGKTIQNYLGEMKLV